MKIRSLFLAFSGVVSASIPTLTISNCKKDGTKVTNITINVDKSTLNVGEAVQLNVTVLPENAANKELEWTVSDSTNCIITNNLVFSTYKSGTYTITAKAKDGSGIQTSKTFIVNEDETTTESVEDYISDRTFSLSLQYSYGTGYSNAINGTCWILSDATPDNCDDYQYYILTNWHVITDARSQSSQLTAKFACKYDDSKPLYVGLDYITFKSIEWLDDSYSTYNNKDKITITESGETKTGLMGCDIHAAKADFGSVVDSTISCAATAKAKLDRLNLLTKNCQKITNLAPLANEKHCYNDLSLYTGGYPKKPSDYFDWEYHSLDEEEILMEYYPTESDFMHFADKKSKPLVDCSPQYVAYEPITSGWMDGGSSGSMIIADFGSGINHIWKVVGIYWGGFKDDAGKYYPCFSIFKSDWKDFVINWE